MRTKSTLTLAVAVLATAAVLAQTPGVHPISGRRFAGVMSYEGARWLDREERDVEEEPDRALDAIRIDKGSTVADVGAGSGYMTIRMARRVGPEGRVYATDVQPQMLAMGWIKTSICCSRAIAARSTTRPRCRISNHCRCRGSERACC